MNKAKYSYEIIKFATVNQAIERYKLGRTVLVDFAKKNGCIIKIGRAVRIDVPKLDEVLEKHIAKESEDK